MHDDSPSRLLQNPFNPTDTKPSWIKDGFVSINIGEQAREQLRRMGCVAPPYH